MNVYDFDKTIFDGDSTFLFLKYAARRRPRIALKAPAVLLNGLLFVTGVRKKQAFKEYLFRSAFAGLDDIDELIRAFWDENAGGIKRWYLAQQNEDDVVITASPVDIVKPVCERIGIRHVLGSPVDLRTGRYAGLNCHGAEKVRRFRDEFPGKSVDEFYSDSHSDDPMARIATRAFLVRGESILPWK